MTAPGPDTDPISELLHCGPLKVWSVVVTVLGDLIQRPDASISGRTLGALIDRMGITNQALRTALHRLRRDGWIVSEKTGRTTAYALSDQGWQTTEAVRPVIYARKAPPRGPVWLLSGAPTQAPAEFAETLPEDAVVLAPRIALSATPVAAAPDGPLVVALDDTPCPDWVQALVADPTLRDDYARFAERVTAILARPLPDALIDRAVLRLLILHHWRRLRLRHGPLPDLVLPEDWAGARARAAVAQAMDRLERPSIADLSGPDPAAVTVADAPPA